MQPLGRNKSTWTQTSHLSVTPICEIRNSKGSCHQCHQHLHHAATANEALRAKMNLRFMDLSKHCPQQIARIKKKKRIFSLRKMTPFSDKPKTWSPTLYANRTEPEPNVRSLRWVGVGPPAKALGYASGLPTGTGSPTATEMYRNFNIDPSSENELGKLHIFLLS
eukprot:s45_g46.t1